jgi:hypothetical protein
MEWFTDDPWRGQTALTLIALMVAAAILGVGRKRLRWAVPSALIWLLLAAMTIPSAIPARPAAQRNACINNLRQIQDAKAEWAKENKKLPADIPTEGDLYGLSGTNGFLRHRLACPRGGSYTFGIVAENSTCSLSSKGHRLE